MALTRVLEETEASLLNIMQDPVLLSEFLRNTGNGSVEKDTWPTRKFKLRWYQRDLLTDKSEFIVLTAGRAVGKCQPETARIYTEDGFVQIRDLIRSGKPSHVVFTMNEDHKFVKARARIGRNGQRPVRRFFTTKGYQFTATDEHPVYTPTGWKDMKDIVVGDEVAAVAKLPELQPNSVLPWFDIRWIGYALSVDRIKPEIGIPLKYQKQVAEMQAIAKYFDCHLVQDHLGAYRMMRKIGFSAHYVSILVSDLYGKVRFSSPTQGISELIKRESNEQIRIMLEAYFSAAAEITESTITVKRNSIALLLDVRELLLRFGIECTLDMPPNEEKTLSITNPEHYALFFSTFKLPGVNVLFGDDVFEPENDIVFDRVTKVTQMADIETYAISVEKHQNYISDYIVCHNSLVLEDKLLFDAVNPESQYPDVTKEHLLVTPNMAQMNLILDRVVSRSMNSPLIRDFLQNKVNRSKGVLDYEGGIVPFKLLARIAGAAGGQTNMVNI